MQVKCFSVTDNDSRGSKGIISICLCVCVCVQHNSKTNDPKVFKLGIEGDFGVSCMSMILEQKVKVQNVEGDGVAGVSLHL